MADEMADKKIWDYCINSAIRRASRQLGQLYDDILAPTGLRNTQHALLTQIGNSGDASLKRLAELMVMDLSALGHTLKPLIRDGYVELVPDGKDKRVKRVRLTESGQQKRLECGKLWLKAQASFDDQLGKEQSDALRQAVNRLSEPDFVRDFTQSLEQP